MENVVFMAWTDVIDSNKAVVVDADISIESNLKSCVEWVKVTMNDWDICNHSQM